MKKLFKIVVIVCPLINVGLIVLLSARNPDLKAGKVKNIDELLPTIEISQYSNVAVEQGNSFSFSNYHSSPRLYFVEHKDCWEE
jgi:hypothetical protein